jgi:hypothetical protein
MQGVLPGALPQQQTATVLTSTHENKHLTGNELLLHCVQQVHNDSTRQPQ